MKLFNRNDESHKLHSTNRPFQSDFNKKNFTGETLLSNDTVKKAKVKYGRKCVFCTGDHWSDECEKYPDISS